MFHLKDMSVVDFYSHHAILFLYILFVTVFVALISSLITCDVAKRHRLSKRQLYTVLTFIVLGVLTFSFLTYVNYDRQAVKIDKTVRVTDMANERELENITTFSFKENSQVYTIELRKRDNNIRVGSKVHVKTKGYAFINHKNHHINRSDVIINHRDY